MPRFGFRAAVVFLFAASAASLLAVFADVLSDFITRRFVETAKAVLAGSATVLLLIDWSAKRHGRWGRVRDGALVVLAAASALAWWNFMQFHYNHYLHYSDTFHYYIGAKYFDELGYLRLYACTAIADAEAGPSSGVLDRDLRDLANNRIQTAQTVLADPDVCKRHFSPGRWDSFARDVSWFRDRVSQARWHEMQRDHGYNAPPSWGMVGGWLANTGPASDRQIRLLAGLDPVLLAILWAFVAWGFGRRALCVALVYWGTNLFGDFGWNGGSFLRQTWLVAAVAGVCCLRKRKHGAAGVLLTLAAGLRIFPVALLLGVALRVGWEVVRQPRARLRPEHVRFLLGCAAALAILALSIPSQGPGAWRAFVGNSATHLATPLKNHVGLRTVLAYDATRVDRRIREGSAVERYETWAEARKEAFARREVLYWVFLAGFVGLLGAAVRDQPDWVAAILAVGLIPVAFELTNYYYSVLLAYGLLSLRWPVIGIALCAIATLSWLNVDLWLWQDEILTWCSLQVVLFAMFCAAWPLTPAGRKRARWTPGP